MKYVNETPAGKQISACVIMRGARYVATVRAHHTYSRTIAEVWDADEAQRRSLKAYMRDHKTFPRCTNYDNEPVTIDDDAAAYYWSRQHNTRGTGSDIEGALSGLYIDGHRMTGHCEPYKTPRKPSGLPGYPRGFKAPPGYSLANFSRWYRPEPGEPWREAWHEEREGGDRHALWTAAEARGDTFEGFSSCHRFAGLRYLTERGYSVIQAI